MHAVFGRFYCHHNVASGDAKAFDFGATRIDLIEVNVDLSLHMSMGMSMHTSRGVSMDLFMDISMGYQWTYPWL